MFSVSLITETASPLSTLARQWQQVSCYHPCFPFIDFECSSQKKLLKVMIIPPTFPHLMALSSSALLKNSCWLQFLWEQRWNSLSCHSLQIWIFFSQNLYFTLYSSHTGFSHATSNTPYSFPNLNYIKIYTFISLQLEYSSSHTILILQISGSLAPL